MPSFNATARDAAPRPTAATPEACTDGWVRHARRRALFRSQKRPRRNRRGRSMTAFGAKRRIFLWGKTALGPPGRSCRWFPGSCSLLAVRSLSLSSAVRVCCAKPNHDFATCQQLCEKIFRSGSSADGARAYARGSDHAHRCAHMHGVVARKCRKMRLSCASRFFSKRRSTQRARAMSGPDAAIRAEKYFSTEPPVGAFFGGAQAEMRGFAMARGSIRVPSSVEYRAIAAAVLAAKSSRARIIAGSRRSPMAWKAPSRAWSPMAVSEGTGERLSAVA